MIEVACNNWNITIPSLTDGLPIIQTFQHRNQPAMRGGGGTDQLQKTTMSKCDS